MCTRAQPRALGGQELMTDVLSPLTDRARDYSLTRDGFRPGLLNVARGADTSAIPRFDTRSQLPALQFKRIFDFTAALLILLVLTPALMIVALAVALSSKGPVLFHQQR